MSFESIEQEGPRPTSDEIKEKVETMTDIRNMDNFWSGTSRLMDQLFDLMEERDEGNPDIKYIRGSYYKGWEKEDFEDLIKGLLAKLARELQKAKGKRSFHDPIQEEEIQGNS